MNVAPKLKVVVLAGGQLQEREVSLRSGQRVATELRRYGHQVELLDLDKNLLSSLEEAHPDLVWPMVHGREGESGSLQDLLQLLSLPYVGTGPQGCRISQSKPVAKSVVIKNGLNTPRSVTLPQRLFKQVGATSVLHEIDRHLGYPLVIKPATGGSAMGISVVKDLNELRNAMVEALAYGDEVLIEEFIEGIEVAVSLIGEGDQITALPAVEIATAGGTYDYDARYLAGRTEFFVPARLSEDVQQATTQLAVSCHRVLELEDLSRIDLIIDKNGRPWFIDANTIPGMTDMSLWPQAAEADAGFTELVNRLALQAKERGAR